MRNYIHIRFEPVSKEQQEILIAQLTELGYEGFEEGMHYISAYITEDQFNEPDIQALIINSGITFTKEVIAPRNWNQEWEQNFQPVIIDTFCAIRAHFHAPVTNVQHEIIITPKMSFGTGHHATTYLMIQGMQQLSFTQKRVLDFGTGTGILAILAEKLGAGEIVAIDNDDWSIENATENIALNYSSRVTVEKAESLEKTGVFDIILANINKNVLLVNMNAIRQHLAPGGVVLMSGLLTGDQPDIEKAAANNNLLLTERKERENWLCVIFKKN